MQCLLPVRVSRGPNHRTCMVRRYAPSQGKPLSHCSLSVPDTSLADFDPAVWAAKGRAAVVANTPNLQLYRSETAEHTLIAAVIYKAWTPVDATPWKLATSDACIITLEGSGSNVTRISVSDPTQGLVNITVVFTGVELIGTGCGVWDPTTCTTTTVATLPGSEWAGTAMGLHCHTRFDSAHTPE